MVEVIHHTLIDHQRRDDDKRQAVEPKYQLVRGVGEPTVVRNKFCEVPKIWFLFQVDTGSCCV